MRQLSTRRLFLSICGCSFFVVLLLYLHGTRILERPALTTSRRGLKHEIFKNVAFRTHLPDFCKKGNTHSEATSIVFVVSEPQNSRRRQIIRTSWGQKKVNFMLGSAIVFVVAGGDVNKYHTQLRLESEVFGDILHHTANDETSTAADKAINMMEAVRWAVENCTRMDFIVEVPDDTFINPFALERLLGDILRGRIPPPLTTSPATAPAEMGQDDEQNQNNRYLKISEESPSDQTTHEHVSLEEQENEDFIYCLVWRNVTVKTSTWMKQEQNLTGSQLHNPPHCSSHGHLFSSRTSKRILAAFRSDGSGAMRRLQPDFYVTGFLADRAEVKHQDIGRGRFVFDLGEVDEHSAFIPLGSDVDALCGSLWKMTIDNE